MATLQAGQYVRAFDGATADKDGVIPVFKMVAQLNQQKSDQAGRPIYDDVEMVEMILVGNPYAKPVEKVHDGHKNRWPEQYRQFKEGQEQTGSGTPLGEAPWLSKAMQAELIALGIKTVENIAAMTDQFLAKNFGMAGQTLRNNAISYLADAEKMAPITAANAAAEKLQAELASRDLQLGEFKNLLEQQSGMIQALQAQIQAGTNAPVQIPQVPLPPGPVSSMEAIKPRRGRPPKAKTE